MPDIFVTENVKSNKTEHPRRRMNRPGFFSSFRREPDGVCFRDQNQDEKILLFLRPNFTKNIPWIITALILSLLPIGILYISPLVSLFPSFFSTKFVSFFIVFYYLLIFNYVFIKFITWHYNISLVTTERIVDIDFSDLVYHNVAMTKLDLVEDVSYSQVGFFATLFNYGDVIVQTAGEMVQFDFLAVNDPSRVVAIIDELIGKVPHAK